MWTEYEMVARATHTCIDAMLMWLFKTWAFPSRNGKMWDHWCGGDTTKICDAPPIINPLCFVIQHGTEQIQEMYPYTLSVKVRCFNLLWQSRFLVRWVGFHDLDTTWQSGSRHESSRIILDHLGLSWITWVILDHLGLSWNHLDHLGLSWNHLDYLGSSRIILDLFDHPLMVDLVRWHHVAPPFAWSWLCNFDWRGVPVAAIWAGWVWLHLDRLYAS